MGNRLIPSERTKEDANRDGSFGKAAKARQINLDGRQSLFKEMKGPDTTGRFEEFRQRAAKLGVDDKGWAAGLARLNGREPEAATPATPTMASAPVIQKPTKPADITKPVQFGAGVAKDNIAKLGIAGAHADYKARSAAAAAGAPVITPKASMPNANQIQSGIANTTIAQPKLGAGAPKVGYDGKGYGQTWQQATGLPKPAAPAAPQIASQPTPPAAPPAPTATQPIPKVAPAAPPQIQDKNPVTFSPPPSAVWNDMVQAEKQRTQAENQKLQARHQRVEQKKASVKVPSWQEGTAVGAINRGIQRYAANWTR